MDNKLKIIAIIVVLYLLYLWKIDNSLINRIQKDLDILEPDLNFIVVENKINNATFTLGKSIIYICTDTKEYNTLLYVAIHELAHVKNKSYGHDINFVKTFKQILAKATSMGLYRPVHYPTNPKKYCGITLDSF